MHKPDFEQVLQGKLAQLDAQKQPERDLWPGIELALVKQEDEAGNVFDLSEKNARANSNNRYWAKASVLAAAVAMLALVSWKGLLPSDDMMSGDELVAALSAQHAEQKNALLVQFEGEVALTNNWQQQLTELDSAAEAIKKALQNEPNNMALLKMLQSVHQQQINLIERVHSPKWSQI
ncbi:conserved hypothetical protein [Paraglaciecola sp. T6c]|uniref:hypothetical protein n=1 Tax=Pseudoalteromonas atlantica (strain T6c / ATCC BAA-1087) TaxID=3042615 RepID=UPI00005C5FE9|nr:hypothetical protein [Paraglaciecola sp. T6c]ABG42243.1 conserved hypothetical protein [Paraglaciecola sp. T6c]